MNAWSAFWLGLFTALSLQTYFKYDLKKEELKKETKCEQVTTAPKKGE